MRCHVQLLIDACEKPVKTRALGAALASLKSRKACEDTFPVGVDRVGPRYTDCLVSSQ